MPLYNGFRHSATFQKSGTELYLPLASRCGNRALTPMFTLGEERDALLDRRRERRLLPELEQLLLHPERLAVVFQKDFDEALDGVVASHLLNKTPFVRTARVDRLAGEHEPGRAAGAHE